jgi:hypothetical protein
MSFRAQMKSSEVMAEVEDKTKDKSHKTKVKNQNKS